MARGSVPESPTRALWSLVDGRANRGTTTPRTRSWAQRWPSVGRSSSARIGVARALDMADSVGGSAHRRHYFNATLAASPGVGRAARFRNSIPPLDMFSGWTGRRDPSAGTAEGDGIVEPPPPRSMRFNRRAVRACATTAQRRCRGRLTTVQEHRRGGPPCAGENGSRTQVAGTEAPDVRLGLDRFWSQLHIHSLTRVGPNGRERVQRTRFLPASAPRRTRASCRCRATPP